MNEPMDRRRGHIMDDISEPATIAPAIATALDWWRAHLGSGVITASWHRSGRQALTVFGRGESWDARDIYGQLGSFSVAVDQIALPVKSANLLYTTDGDNLDVEVSFKLPLDKLSVKSSMRAEPMQSMGITPMIIVSGLSMVWNLFNTRCDLILPGEISLTGGMEGDSLELEFLKFPSIRLTSLFTMQMTILSVSIRAKEIVIHLDSVFCPVWRIPIV